MLWVGIGFLQPRGRSNLWKPFPHFQSVGSSGLCPPGAPPSCNLDPSLALHEGSGQAGVNVPNQCCETPARGPVQGMCSTSQTPASSVAQAPDSHIALALHPPISCCLCWALGGFLLSEAGASLTHTPRFMEFEAEDEMQIQKLQLMKGVQGPPPPAPPRPDPQGLPAPVLDPQPGMAAHSQRNPWPKATGP